MKNKNSSFVISLSALFMVAGVFFLQINTVEAKDCPLIKKNIIEKCQNAIDAKTAPENMILAPDRSNDDAFSIYEKEKAHCEELGKKEYNLCIGSAAAVSECEQERITNKTECEKRSIAAGDDKAKMEARCIISVESQYKQCVGAVSGQFELPSGIDGLNQFQGLSISEVIGNFMGTALKILGSIAFAIMVSAGLIWMTAGGNSDRQRKAMDMMVWAALGVVVILSSATIVKFVFDAFTN